MAKQHNSTKNERAKKRSFVSPPSPPDQHVSYTALIAVNGENNSNNDRSTTLTRLIDKFELPMSPISTIKAKRTISMESIKVHVDEEDYRRVATDDNEDASWKPDEQDLLAGTGAEKEYLG